MTTNSRSKQKQQGQQIQFWMSRDRKVELIKIAQSKGLSLSELMRALCNRCLIERKLPQSPDAMSDDSSV